MEVKEIISRITVKALILGGICHFGAYLTRSVRFIYALDYKFDRLERIFLIHTINNFYNQILPGGAGEVSLPLLLRKLENKNLAIGTAILFFVRVLDILILLILLILTLLFGDIQFRAEIADAIRIITLASIIIIVFLILVLFLLISSKNRLLKIISDKFNTIKKLIQYFLGQFDDPWRLAKIIFYTLFSNFCVIFTFWALLSGLDIRLSLFQIIIAVTILTPVYLLPIRGIAGFGSIEGGWALSLWILGYDKTVGVAAGFSIHIITLVYVIILAAPGFWLLFFKPFIKKLVS